MSRLAVLLIAFLVSGMSHAAYTTSCEIRSGKAYGYVHNRGDSFEIDGTLWFYFYDNRGSLIDQDSEYEYEYVSGRDTEEIDYTSAPSNAYACTFDISQAIKGDDPHPTEPIDSRYGTSCQIRDGQAYGFVHNHGDSFTIDGTIWFYFYDNRGEFIDDEDDYEYEYVSSRSTEEIDYTGAPSNAFSCTFSVAGAIEVFKIP
ncbi:MAG: hypothetical protein IPK04_12630 [Bdellovibrionales bacterium]|nr:hypothetical protein [Bdellovibrionales bacterium]